MKTRAASFFCVLMALSVGAWRASAQNYSINWSKVAGGGGTSTNGQYTVSGTIGQPDAGAPMSSGQYSVTGGFWAVTAVQTVGAPLLTIRGAGNSVIISWPSASTGFQLQASGNVATPVWLNFPSPTNDDGTNKSVIISPPAGTEFFRLKH